MGWPLYQTKTHNNTHVSITHLSILTFLLDTWQLICIFLLRSQLVFMIWTNLINKCLLCMECCFCVWVQALVIYSKNCETGLEHFFSIKVFCSLHNKILELKGMYLYVDFLYLPFSLGLNKNIIQNISSLKYNSVYQSASKHNYRLTGFLLCTRNHLTLWTLLD